MTSELMALGFVGEYLGAEDTLTYHRPVVEYLGRPHVSMRVNWTLDDLVPLPDSDSARIQRLPEPRSLEVGQVVWLVGATLYNRCQRLRGAQPMADEFARWRLFRGAFNYRFATFDSIVTIARSWFRDILRHRLYIALYSPPFLDRGVASDYLRTIEALPLEPGDRVWLLVGLYYREVRDDERYALARQLAVLDGVCEGPDEFDQIVEDRANWLRKERLFESSHAAVGNYPVEPSDQLWNLQVLMRETLETVRLNRPFLHMTPRLPDDLTVEDFLKR